MVALSGAGTLSGTRRIGASGGRGLSGSGRLSSPAAGPGLLQYTYRPRVQPDRTHRIRWRYLAQNILTKQWLHTELPLRRDDMSYALSGPGSLRGSISPVDTTLLDDSGDPILKEWSTAIYAEADGEIRWGGLVIRGNFVGPTWTVECAGFTTYPKGMPYTGPLWSKINVAPETIFRAIWSHLQQQPDGNLGVLTKTQETPVRLGIPGVPAYIEAFVDGKWQREDKLPKGAVVPDSSTTLATKITATVTQLTIKSLSNLAQNTMPYVLSIGSEKVRVTARSGLKLTVTRGADGTKKTAHSKGVGVKFAGTKRRRIDAIDAEPYQLAWWESTDCGSEIDKLATETPFDYIEDHRWDGDDVEHSVRMYYPRVGRRREDLVFSQGANVITVVEVETTGDDFANHIVSLGQGEGVKKLRAESAVRDGRVRRVSVISDETVKTTARLSKKARDEQRRRRLLPDISSITVQDHPNAPIGSWRVGDDILVQAVVSWLGYTEIWCRIVEWTMTGDYRATLTLLRSDSFEYGPQATIDTVVVGQPGDPDKSVVYGAGLFGGDVFGGTAI